MARLLMAKSLPMTVHSDRTLRFDRTPEQVWDAIGRVDEFRGWWPWLRRFDADALQQGDRWECTVRPPVPYVLRFAVSLDHVHRPSSVRATVSGDIEGHAELSISPATASDPTDNCDVRLVSALDPSSQTLRAVNRLAPWLARFGHDWVLDTGLGQFRRHAL